jgi:cysteinyl-tRNA synthetase
MRLYNTATKQIEDVKPQHDDRTTVYTCGPTVYDYPHIGNWFTFIRYDILVRTLKAEGQNVEWVMNITDVGHLVSDADDGEDKLEKGARREDKTAWDIARFYSDYFVEALKRLNFSTPAHLPRATDHIEEQIELIKRLEAKGFTYKIVDGIYFDTGKFPTYGNFAQLDLDEQQAGARVEYNPQKRQPTDFALWKFSPADKQRDMEWDSPWGRGFPGWHLECSAMSMKYLGETIDIHSGGIDHVPVHHTNEIAQSEAATGRPFARYWMHTNHILVGDEKIAKSAGNGITLEDIEAKGYSLDDFRLHVLESHYRSQSKFGWDSLESAHNRLTDLRAMAALRWQARDDLTDQRTFILSDVAGELLNALRNDLHTEAALQFLSTISKQLLTVLLNQEFVDEFAQMLESIDSLLGTRLSEVHDITDEQKMLIERREQARRNQDWQAADDARHALEERRIGLRDTPHGPVWFPL